ncbi:hypothetical protein LZQ00_12295 [Sphingobacterium sp. SRCM116780]|uniref:hypothetical protein n=1 Tax=Sphingobacterium sp. SRCM116780 TaxID=2907623 RepID=UPI001F1EBB65|nr:hypothetical protein [Sphingobacterium sp. SRCM116780]UIR55059.1 hypothetical protein LZQ00_12295 [Sphingobacterium sp. SRCM116780]
MRNIGKLLTVLFFTIGCNRNNVVKKDLTQPVNNSDTVVTVIDTASVFTNNQIEEYQKNVINKGDVGSFSRLLIHYDNLSNYKELHKYALIMADKYNNGAGCNQVFVDIVAINNNNDFDINALLRLNEKDKSTALKYLKKGALLNDIESILMLAEIYRNGIGVEKDVKKADELKKKIEEI